MLLTFKQMEQNVDSKQLYILGLETFELNSTLFSKSTLYGYLEGLFCEVRIGD